MHRLGNSFSRYFIELEWAPEPDTHGSDHFPCIIELTTNRARNINNDTRYSLINANLKLFKELSIIQEDEYDMTKDINSLVNKFNTRTAEILSTIYYTRQ